MPATDVILARLEVEVEHLKKDVERQGEMIQEMSSKVQLLLDAANMGRGAWWIILKIGAFMSAASMAALWIYEKAKSLLVKL